MRDFDIKSISWKSLDNKMYLFLVFLFTTTYATQFSPSWLSLLYQLLFSCSMFVLLKGRTIKECFQIGSEIASAVTASPWNWRKFIILVSSLLRSVMLVTVMKVPSKLSQSLMLKVLRQFVGTHVVQLQRLWNSPWGSFLSIRIYWRYKCLFILFSVSSREHGK